MSEQTRVIWVHNNWEKVEPWEFPNATRYIRAEGDAVYETATVMIADLQRQLAEKDAEIERLQDSITYQDDVISNQKGKLVIAERILYGEPETNVEDYSRRKLCMSRKTGAEVLQALGEATGILDRHYTANAPLIAEILGNEASMIYRLKRGASVYISNRMAQNMVEKFDVTLAQAMGFEEIDPKQKR